jgi:hypothetical protein
LPENKSIIFSGGGAGPGGGGTAQKKTKNLNKETFCTTKFKLNPPCLIFGYFTLSRFQDQISFITTAGTAGEALLSRSKIMKSKEHQRLLSSI